MTARVIIALAACAAAFEHEQRACPGDQPTNVWLALRLRQKYVMLRESARMHETTTQLRLAKAIASPAECRYTVCFLSYRDFREAGALRSHERAFDKRLDPVNSKDNVLLEWQLALTLLGIFNCSHQHPRRWPICVVV